MRHLVVVLLLLAWGASVLPGAESYPLREAVECHERGGLGHVGAKLAAGQPVRIAYLGGSITAAPGWRVKTLAWFKERYPQAAVSGIDAAIGGTGSDLGVYRVGFDALRHHPDLLFVEFAVNDSGADPVEIQRGMEGIVRQTWSADPATDICFVYTLTGGMVAELQGGRFPRAASAMEAVADHYRIPSLHFGVEVVKRIGEQTLVFKAAKDPSAEEKAAIGSRLVFTNDDVHPLDAGHVLYAEVAARHLPALLTAAPTAHVLPAPLLADNHEHASLLPLERVMPGAGWVKLDPASDGRAKDFANRMPSLYRAEQPGARLTFRFRGTAVGVYDLLGPDCGQVVVTIDGGAPRTIPRIDGYCTYHRIAFLRLASGLAAGEHTVDIRLDAAAPDKAKILFEHNRPDLEKDPARYAGNRWYVGGIMLIGDLVP
jgi:lysophospholipase L1-like esterase